MSEVTQAAAPNVVTRRQRSTLDRLQKFAGVEDASLDAVLNLINPFPDYVEKRVGWPDSQPTPSVVVVDTYDLTVSQPPGLAAGVTWDMHASVLPTPFAANSATINGTISNTGLYTAGTADLLYFPSSLNILTNTTGGSLDPIAGPNTGSATNAGQYSYGAQAAGSNFRIVAQGLEVINTSAALYKGGMAYAYRYAPMKTTISNSIGGLAVPIGSYVGNATLLPFPPVRASSIINYSNTYEGEACDGVYVINAPATSRNDYYSNVGAVNYFCNTPGNISASNVTQCYSMGSATDWSYCGAFLTGLAQGSSITIRFRTYLEVAPAPSDGNSWIRLVNPSTPYNATINDILTKILVDMPAGCAYTDNPLGEWFNSLMEFIESAAPIVGDVVGNFIPGAKLIGSTVGSVAKTARKINGGKKQIKKKKPEISNANKSSSSSAPAYPKNINHGSSNM